MEDESLHAIPPRRMILPPHLSILNFTCRSLNFWKSILKKFERQLLDLSCHYLLGVHPLRERLQSLDRPLTACGLYHSALHLPKLFNHARFGCT